jgi:hypothetical protein
MNTLIIMVQIADHQWTLDALHRACLLARDMNAEIALMKMVPVQHLGWLGTEFGNINFTAKERSELHDYEATAEDYGVPYSTHVFQYATLLEAISEAADYVKAHIVFATLPQSVIPFWQRFQLWGLRNRLAHGGRELFDPSTLLTAKPHKRVNVTSVPIGRGSDR